MRLSIAKLVTFSFLMIAPFVANAQVIGTIKIDLSIIEQKGDYSYNEKTKSYEAKSLKARSIQVFSGTGAFASFSNKTDSVTSAAPGIDFKGHHRITLAPKGDKLMIKVDTLIDDTFNGVKIKDGSKVEFETEFVSGNMKSLEQGEQVVVKLTEAGKKTFMQDQVDSFEKGMKASLANASKGAKLEIRTEGLKTSGDGKFEITKTRIIQMQPEVSASMIFSFKR